MTARASAVRLGVVRTGRKLLNQVYRQSYETFLNGLPANVLRVEMGLSPDGNVVDVVEDQMFRRLNALEGRVA